MIIALGVSLGSPEEFGCTISIDRYSADTVSLFYKGLPANRPQDNNNFIAIWEASMIPWKSAPLKKIFIEDNNEEGSYAIDGLTITSNSYILGYGVGSDITTICCSCMLKAGGLAAAPTSVSIGLESIEPNALAIHYQTLGGYLPQQYGNWIGLWKGYASPYNAPDPVGKVMVDSNSSEDVVAMNNVGLGINSDYTLIYFVGKGMTTAAAILNFSTGP